MSCISSIQCTEQITGKAAAYPVLIETSLTMVLSRILPRVSPTLIIILSQKELPSWSSLYPSLLAKNDLKVSFMSSRIASPGRTFFLIPWTVWCTGCSSFCSAKKNTSLPKHCSSFLGVTHGQSWGIGDTTLFPGTSGEPQKTASGHWPSFTSMRRHTYWGTQTQTHQKTPEEIHACLMMAIIPLSWRFKMKRHMQGMHRPQQHKWSTTAFESSRYIRWCCIYDAVCLCRWSLFLYTWQRKCDLRKK